MTISTTVSRVDAPGNGSATTFSFSPIIITQASDLLVWLLDNDGNQTLLAQGAGPTNYAINTPMTYPGTGSITYPGSGGTTLATGWKLTMKQRVPQLQTFQPQNQGPFLASTYGAAFDYLMLAIQELQEQINRTIISAETDVGNLSLPTALARANNLLGFDSNGNAIAAQPSSALVSTLMKPIVAASTVQGALNLLTANAVTQSLSGQFYESNGALVNRVADRLLVGQAIANSGNLILPVAQGTAGGWLDYYQALISLEPTASAQFISMAGGTDGSGTLGAVGASQSLNFSSAFQTAIGVVGYSYNNNTTLATAGWSFYGESYRMNTTVGSNYGHEQAVVNQSGATSYLTPYTSQSGITVCFQADSGNGYDAALQPGLDSASAAYTIVQNTSDNSAPFLRGIVALNSSIASNGGNGVHEALTLPVAYGIQWYNSSGTANSFIQGNATAATNAAALAFNTDGAEFLGASAGVPIASFTPVASSVNYVNIQGAATGNAPGVYAAGSDTNVNLVIAPQGTASILTGGGVLPNTTNTYSCGSSGNKWTAVYATNGTIQTSDGTLKTDVAPLPDALPIIAALNPVTYRWKSGGMKPVAKQVEVDQPVYEEGDTTIDEPQLQANGTWQMVPVTVHYRRPVYDDVPVVNADGTPVLDTLPRTGRDGKGKKTTVYVQTPRMHRVQRTQKATVTQYDLVDEPGKRTHWGFLAADIKAATPAGMDWAAYVKADDGTEHMRPDQLIPVLWKANQEMLAMIREQAQEIAALKAWATAVGPKP